MKNLNLLFTLSKEFSVDNVKFLLPNQNDFGILYLVTTSTIHEVNVEKDSVKQIYEGHEIESCEYLALNNEICIATSEGSVAVLNLITGLHEEVTFCGGGIEAMAWSPDQEVVAFVTKSKNVVVMSCTFDPIMESSLDDAFFGDQEFITVGWGKKETQFHGSEGKNAAKQKPNFIEENINELKKTLSISWRGDGALFTVSFVGTNGRMFKVYDREGQLQFTSERQNGLGVPISWRPSGNWIGVPQNLSASNYVVALFEKNGLRHREIVLPFKYEEEPIERLLWSADSDILAIETLKEGKSLLYLYTICNYHWYLKQYLPFDEQLAGLSWDFGMNEGKTLHVLSKTGKYFLYKWEFGISTSFGYSINNQSIVSVIDGKKLLLTDFRNNIIPPPMSSYQIESDSGYINFTGFLRNFENSKKESNQLFTIDSNQKLRLYDLEFEETEFCRRLVSSKLLKQYKIPYDLYRRPLASFHWLWLSQSKIIFCEQSKNDLKDWLCLAELNDTDNDLEIVNKTKIDGKIYTISDRSWNTIVLQSLTKKVYSVNIENGKFSEPEFIIQLPDLCENLIALDRNNCLQVFAHKSKQNLYLNGNRISSDVTSVFVTENYCVFTLLNSMKFLRLDNEQIVDERQIERGGKLITIIPKDSRSILQMPRGNLEAIQPKVLSLCIVGDFLNALEYCKAMELLRKQRINLNILIDHNPEKFFKNIDRFLEEISNPSWLNLFLSDLKNEDCTKTMYAGNYAKDVTNYPEHYRIENKINFVCESLCERMKQRNSEAYILPIITAYVKRGELEKALEIIWMERKKEAAPSQRENLNVNSMSKSENALKYLLYLVDVNELYNFALGMYDFGLVLFVANKSQKDPKEYIPFLNELKKFDENYRKFKIDDHLKRYERALENIARCGSVHFDECLQFVEKHKLYTSALLQFEASPECYKRLAQSFADYLRAQGKHESASVMYERCGDLQQAIMSAKHVINWQRCLLLTKRLYGESKEEMENIVLALVPALIESGKYEEAAQLVQLHCNNFSLAISLLMKGRLYLNAIYEARMCKPELIESTIEPHLETYKDVVQGAIETDFDQFMKYEKRLSIVRKEKLERKKQCQDLEENDGLIDVSDLISEASTLNSSNYTGSSGTGKTFRSSKNRRKHERKLLSLKEGNAFEDIALIDALYTLVQKVLNQQEHIRDINKALIELSFDRDARLIQRSFNDLLEFVKNSLDEIWIPEMMNGHPILSGPNVDYVQLQNEQHYSLIKPHQRYKPQLNLIDWQHEILK